MKNDNENLETDALESKAPAISFEEQEFNNWCDANDIDRAVDGMDDDDRKNFAKIKRRFCLAIQQKRLVINGDTFSYTISERSPNAGKVLNVSRPNGRAMLAMDGYKENQQQQKLQAFIAAITGTQKRDIAIISELDSRDLQLLQDVAILFLTA